VSLAGRDDGRAAWRDFKGELEALGFRPSRRFGQNFLVDENMVRAIVRDAQLPQGARVLEIGTGLGFLTLHLLREGCELVTVEVDPRLFELSGRALAAERPCTRLLCDALDGKHALAPAVRAALWTSGDWHLVANLPYSIASPLLVILADLDNPPASFTTLVQKEAAERVAGAPGTDDWGALSARLQADYDCRIVRAVAPGLFWPRPQVDSSVVRGVRRAQPLERERRVLLQGLLARLFQRRRQTLGRVLADLLDDRAAALAWLEEARLEGGARAEDLALDPLLRLVDAARPDPRRADALRRAAPAGRPGATEGEPSDGPSGDSESG
jgi:16S rRNA (adenine1518-N6/adenine1519-N6)-dimethyltransferase